MANITLMLMMRKSTVRVSNTMLQRKPRIVFQPTIQSWHTMAITSFDNAHNCTTSSASRPPMSEAGNMIRRNTMIFSRSTCPIHRNMNSVEDELTMRIDVDAIAPIGTSAIVVMSSSSLVVQTHRGHNRLQREAVMSEVERGVKQCRHMPMKMAMPNIVSRRATSITSLCTLITIYSMSLE